ncbi:hypothetical protein QTP86_026426 [Hemibagrus guttatus]|nr:hypothetical protein QTP86_026426 [Hemibagrus guttatus]
MEKNYRTTSGKFWQTVQRLRRGKQLSANTVYSGGEAEDSEVDSFIPQAEVTEVVQQLLGGKASGVDEIRPEYLKSLDVVGLSWLTRLCNIAWQSGTVPLDWATGVVIPLFTKGDRRVCSNYRGITLLSLPGKVYSRVLERTVRPLVEPRIQEEQCGFQPSRGTLDQLYTLHRVLEGSWEFAQPVHMCFVDLEKAFDRVPHGILWEVLWEYRVCGPLLRAVWSLYNRSRSLVRIASCKSDLFPVHVGLRQGCPLSPVLFIVFMDRISRCSQGLEGVWFGDHRISLLIFADDVVLLAPSSLGLQHALGHFAAECEAAGMRVSTSKSEAMVLHWKKVACTLQVGGEVLAQVEQFKYLGVLFTSEGRMDCEIDRLIGAAAAVMRSMYRSVVVKKELSRKAKLLIYQSIYVPTLTYGHELWVMTERNDISTQRAYILRALSVYLNEDYEKLMQEYAKPKNLSWTSGTIEAFQKLKAAFCTAPNLIHADPTWPFVVEVDASALGVGAIFSQRRGETPILHPCAYFSKKLSPAEQNYDIGDRELLAIKLAL